MIRRKQARWLLRRVALGFAIAVNLMGGDFEWSLPKGFSHPDFAQGDSYYFSSTWFVAQIGIT
jgi:hypothetical protein